MMVVKFLSHSGTVGFCIGQVVFIL